MEPSCSSGLALVAYTSKQKPSRSLSRCLLKPLNGTVSLASGQVLGTLANDCMVNPPFSGRPATSSLVCPACCLSRDAGSTPAVSLPNSLKASSNLSKSALLVHIHVSHRHSSIRKRLLILHLLCLLSRGMHQRNASSQVVR